MMIIKGGYARDKRQARMLLQQYGLDRARDLIPLLPHPKRVPAREKLRRLIMRILGEDQHPLSYVPRSRPHLPEKVTFRRPKQ